MIEFRIDEERCVQCGECAADCPAGVIAMENYPELTDEEGCIQCQHCLAVCPTAAVSILGKNPDDSRGLAGNLPEAERLNTLIKGRRSVRRYKKENLPPALIDEMLDIACHAPTGINSRSVMFSVIRERSVMQVLREEVLHRLAESKQQGRLPAGYAGQYLGFALSAWQSAGRDIIFRDAPHLLLTSAPREAPCPVQDAHIALATFELAAAARGIGTLWDGMFMTVLDLFPDLTARLGIAGDHLPGYAMVFGAPAVEYHRTVQRGPARVNVISL